MRDITEEKAKEELSEKHCMKCTRKRDEGFLSQTKETKILQEHPPLQKVSLPLKEIKYV